MPPDPLLPPPFRVTFVIRDLGHGGAQRQLTALACALATRPGWEISVVHFYPGVFEEELRRAGVKTLCVGKRHRWDLAGFAFRLVRALRATRPDVVHGYLNEGNLMALLLRPLCRWPRVVWGLRDSRTDAHLWGALGRLSFWLNCKLARFAHLIIANSQAGRDYYTAQGYPAARIEVVPNGIDTQRFQPPPAPPSSATTTDAFTFGIIGRLNPMKGHDVLLEAFAQVRQTHPGARLLIVGAGADSTTDPWVAARRAQATSLGLGSHITWLPAQEEMPAVYARLDCLVSASGFGEGFSNVIGEAMACGLPCVATEVGDAALLVRDPRLLCPPQDPAALAERMRRVLAMPAADRAELGAQNRYYIEGHHTPEKLAGRTADLLWHLPPPLRVCFVTTGLGTGGAEMMLWQLLGRFDRARISPSVISLTPGGKYLPLIQEGGTPVISLDMPAGRPGPRALARLWLAMWRLRPQVLMGWMYHGCLAAALARLALPWPVAQVWNIRQSLYDLALEKKGSAFVIRALAWLGWVPRAITYNSEVSARQHEAIGYPAARTVLIPNGFDLDRWKPAAPPPQTAEPAAHRPRRVGRFGRFAAMKDYPTFLEAAARVRLEMPDTRFVLVGTGVDAANTALTADIERLGLTHHVDLLGERNDLPEITASLDVAVSSSAFGEGFPNVVGEAMACAVPVVATDIGDSAWVQGDVGRRVPPRDAAALAETILIFLRLPEAARQEEGWRGRSRILSHFSLQVAINAFEYVLHKAVRRM